MPEFLVSNGGSMPKYARIDEAKKGAVFVEMAEATGFGSPELAEEAFSQACLAMGKRASRAGWVDGWLMRSPEGRKSHCPIASRATMDDLCGVFEAYFIRCDRGWLSRPQRKYAEGQLVWDKAFGLAVSFTSKEAALAELARHGRDGCVVKASCAFTSVETAASAGKGSGAADPVRSAIQAACEARDLEASLIQAAKERLAASKSGGLEEKAQRSRL